MQNFTCDWWCHCLPGHLSLLLLPAVQDEAGVQQEVQDKQGEKQERED